MRDETRKEHEWKKHGAEDCRHLKGTAENRASVEELRERRLHLPRVEAHGEQRIHILLPTRHASVFPWFLT
jgi:hypothetical protein